VLDRVTRVLDSARGRRRPRLAHLVAILLVVFALVSSACTSTTSSGPGTTATSPKVTEIRNVSDLQERFNRDAGQVRLILLVAPT